MKHAESLRDKPTWLSFSPPKDEVGMKAQGKTR